MSIVVRFPAGGAARLGAVSTRVKLVTVRGVGYRLEDS